MNSSNMDPEMNLGTLYWPQIMLLCIIAKAPEMQAAEEISQAESRETSYFQEASSHLLRVMPG